MTTGARIDGVPIGALGAIVSDSEEVTITSTGWVTLGRPMIFPEFSGQHMVAKVVALAVLGTFDLKLKSAGGIKLFEKLGISNTSDVIIDLGPILNELAAEDIVVVRGRVGSAGDSAILKSVYVRL